MWFLAVNGTNSTNFYAYARQRTRSVKIFQLLCRPAAPALSLPMPLPPRPNAKGRSSFFWCGVMASERWKVTWAISTCAAVGIATFLGLWNPSRRWMQREYLHVIGPAFTGSITAAVKDRTSGATIYNGIACIIACAVPTVLSYCIYVVAGDRYSYAVALPSVFIIVLLAHYIEFHALAKKLAIAMVSINLFTRVLIEPRIVFFLYVDVLTGIACAMLGTLIPWPQLARAELRERLLFTAEAVQLLLEDGVREWQFITETSTSASALYAMHNCSSVEARRELTIFVVEGIAEMRARARECIFLPYEQAMEAFHHEVFALLEELLLVVQSIELRKTSMTRHKDTYHVYQAFMGVRFFSEALSIAVARICSLLGELIESRGMRPLESAVSALRSSILRLDNEYSRCREWIYWAPVKHAASKEPTADVLFNLNGVLFLVDAAAARVIRASAAIQHIAENGTPLTAAYVVSSLYRNLIKPLVPPQVPVFVAGSCDLNPAATRRMRQCVCLSSAMILAAVYGYLGERDKGFVAAFTVAFLAGDDVAGATMLTSLNRAAGTVIACVYSALVLIIAQAQAVRGNREVFLGIAIVLFMFPATYIRTYTTAGYVGTVAALTVPILLLNYGTGLKTAFDRIIDTYVGAFIFVVLEFAIVPHYSDDILLTQMDRLFRGIRDNFASFVEVFTNRNSSDFALNLSLQTAFKHEKGVVLYAAHEISLFRPPPFLPTIVEEVMKHQKLAYNSLQIMTWAVAVRTQKQSELLKEELQLHLDNMIAYVNGISTYLSSSTSELKGWRRLVAERSDCSLGDLLREVDESASLGEVEMMEAQRVVQHYETRMSTLIRVYKEGHGRAEFVSSTDVKLMNAVYASSKDFLEAMTGLTSAYFRMKAYRNVRCTQDGRKKRF